MFSRLSCCRRNVFTTGAFRNASAGSKTESKFLPKGIGTDYNADINRYFQRIHYSGCRDTSLKVLRDIMWCHMKAIPFENLNLALGKPPPLLDVKDVEDKFMNELRGGYCIEHSILLLNIFKQLGFESVPLLGRSVSRDGVAHANYHGIMKVRCENRDWLVDCGFGPYGPTVPLEISDDFPEFETKVFPHRVYRQGDLFIHQAKGSEFHGITANEWETHYTFKLDEAFAEDYEVASWYGSTHPDAFFSKNVLVSKFWEDKRCFLLNRKFECRGIGEGSSSKNVVEKEIESQEEYISILKEYFNLTFPEGTALVLPGHVW